MKKLRSIGCCLMICLLLLAGCGVQDEWEAALKAAVAIADITEDDQLRADTEKMLDAIILDDYQTAWDTIYQEVDPSQFHQAYQQIQTALKGISQYELVASNINKTVTNGMETVHIRYMMTAGEQRFFVEAARVEGYDGLVSFFLNAYEPITATGTLGSMQGASVSQWIFLVIGLLELAVTIFAFVDCCRHKMRKKWLWLLLIGVGAVVFSVIVTPEQFRINFNFGAFLGYTSLISYSDGGYILQIMIPVGAIVYLCIRKKIFEGYKRYMQKKAVQQMTSSETLIEAEQSVAATEEIPAPPEE